MSEPGQRARGLRRATSFACVLALLVHIVAMGFGAMGSPGGDIELAQAHAHHSALVAGSEAKQPPAQPQHEPPCCILSLCPGMPGPSGASAPVDLPPETGLAIVSERDAAPATARLLLSPLGARAPPALARS